MIILRGFPVALFEASSQQWSDVLRDYLLRGIGGADQPYGPDDIARSVRALDQVRTCAAFAVDREPDTDPLDVLIELQELTAGDFAVLQGALDHGRQLAIAGKTLTLPALPEVVALRDWMCEEILAQAAGGEATPWRFTEVVLDDGGLALAEWDVSLAPPDDEPWIIGDDHNRIIGVSSSAESILGWEPGELVGQRLLAVIPDRLREQHVAGFTRGVVNGEHRLLGQPLQLPALRKDGSEIPITLTLTRHAAKRARSVFIARLDPSAQE
ncbi:MAG TPA: PAS domain S-box protein [Mycobacteriales bacterium]|nr:PAS domain S-box protein [Mycobacteriales bacterium]